MPQALLKEALPVPVEFSAPTARPCPAMPLDAMTLAGPPSGPGSPLFPRAATMIRPARAASRIALDICELVPIETYPRSGPQLMFMMCEEASGLDAAPP